MFSLLKKKLALNYKEQEEEIEEESLRRVFFSAIDFIGEVLDTVHCSLILNDVY